jgi:hypothetical protein
MNKVFYLTAAFVVALAQPALAQTPVSLVAQAYAEGGRPGEEMLWAPPICRVEWWRCSSLHADEGICRPPGHREGRYCIDEYRRER